MRRRAVVIILLGVIASGCTGAGNESASPPYTVTFYVMNERVEDVNVTISSSQEELFSTRIQADDRGGTVVASDPITLHSSPIELTVHIDALNSSQSVSLMKENHLLVRISGIISIENFSEPPQFA